MKKSVTIVIPGRGAVEAESAEDAFRLLPALQAKDAPRFDGHLVAEALRRKDDVEVKTRCGLTLHFDVPLRPEDANRSKLPLTCETCKR